MDEGWLRVERRERRYRGLTEQWIDKPVEAGT
jgi:hypothetical protein